MNNEERILQAIEKMSDRLDGMESKIDGIEVKMDERFIQIDGRFEQIDERFEKMDGRIGSLESNMTMRFDMLETRQARLASDLEIVKDTLIDYCIELKEEQTVIINKQNKFDEMMSEVRASVIHIEKELCRKKTWRKRNEQ